MMRCRMLVALLALCLNACAYHLVGQGDGGVPDVIPQGATHFRIVQSRQADEALQRMLSAFLQDKVALMVADTVQDDAHVLVVHIEQEKETWAATSFDANGVANQYRLSFLAQVSLMYQGKEQWRSSLPAISGDVFAAGGAVSIEVQRASLKTSLRQQWLRRLKQQMQSGF